MRAPVTSGVLLALGAGALAAHDLFLKLDTYFVPADATVRVAVLNGTFLASENAVTDDRLLDLSLVGPAGRTALDRSAWRPAGDSMVLTIRTGSPGTYVVGASTAPLEIDLTAAEFNEYLEHDGIPDVLDARRRAGELERAVRERYHKHVKALFQAGDRRTDGFGTALGYPAELVPVTNPYGLSVGDTLRLRCLVDGMPVANQLVVSGGEAAPGALRPERRVRSDVNGIVTVALDAPGKWYVKFIHMERSRAPAIDYESKWASLTFEIGR